MVGEQAEKPYIKYDIFDFNKKNSSSMVLYKTLLHQVVLLDHIIWHIYLQELIHKNGT